MRERGREGEGVQSGRESKRGGGQRGRREGGKEKKTPMCKYTMYMYTCTCMYTCTLYVHACVHVHVQCT